MDLMDRPSTRKPVEGEVVRMVLVGASSRAEMSENIE